MSRKLKHIENSIRKYVSKNIVCREWHESIILEGEVTSWDLVIKAGKMAANIGYKGVVNRVYVSGLALPEIKLPVLEDAYLERKKVDVLIIGGGITGTAIARALSKWDMTVLLVEKEDDLAMHASSRNDGMVHTGIEAKPGSLRSKYNVKGNEMYTQFAKELDVPLERIGSNILFDKKWLMLGKPILMARAKKTGVPGVSLLSRKELLNYEPYIMEGVAGAVHFETTGITSPYKMTIACAENAVMNGVEVSLNTIVHEIAREKDRIISVRTNRGTLYPTVVVNAAGVFADNIADMAGDKFFTIHPRKGEIVLLDKKKQNLIHSVISKPSLALRQGNTKGGGLLRTIDGNILVGPNAYEQPYKEDYSTNRENIDSILKKHLPMIKGLSPADVITYCAGIRAATYEEDFIIERSEYVKNLVYAAGIQSPGFASAPAIAEEIEKLTLEALSEVMTVKKKEKWNPIRKGIPDLARLSIEERSMLIKQRTDYGTIICRCEEVSKGEIIDAIQSPIPIKTIDGIKRRVRAGAGRCQGGFCMPLVMDIISKQTGTDMTEINKKGRESNIVVGETKSVRNILGR